MEQNEVDFDSPNGKIEEIIIKCEIPDGEYEQQSTECNFNEKLVKKEPDDINVPEYVTDNIKAQLSCPQCPYVGKSRGFLNRHVNTKHASVPRFKCDVCGYSTEKKALFANHQLSHKKLDELSLLRCTECPYTTKYRSDLKRHENQKHSSSPRYKCDRCDYSAPSNYHLTVHLVSHDSGDTGVFRCDRCLYKTKYERYLKLHVNQKHSDSPKYKCHVCDYPALSKTSLSRHLLSHTDDSDTVMLLCEHCAFKTKYKNNLQRHQDQKHSDLVKK